MGEFVIFLRITSEILIPDASFPSREESRDAFRTWNSNVAPPYGRRRGSIILATVLKLRRPLR